MQTDRRKTNTFSVDNFAMLVRLETKVDYLTTEVKEMRDNTAKRLETLETGKFDSKDFTETWGKMIGDHEIRMRALESTVTKYIAYAAAAVFVFEIVINYISRKI